MLEDKLKEKNIHYQMNVSLKDYTTLHIGGNVSYVVFPTSIDEIQYCIQLCQNNRMNYRVIGKGSNLLALDQGYSGMLIVLNQNYSKIELVDSTHVSAQSGATLKEVCDFCLQHCLTGLEFACGIPGSVGGAICMNAGAYGGEMKDVVESVIYLDKDLNVQTLTLQQLQFSYRHSYFSEHQDIVLAVIFHFKHGVYEIMKETMDDLMHRRRTNQPMDAYSAGSTFKRPQGHYASALIKQCGLQGYHVGDAQVSLKHAGFLINNGQATSQEFLQLIKHVQDTVYQQTGYQLECEIKILSNES